ncbi:hypothetical protein H8356DRAFT_1359246 [Neocallimastix lanati (nom. inval.)]|nr:hypothetical protein H8356DRAFT_1359246 [Neocallimastix sp. JGI-2020a]
MNDYNSNGGKKFTFVELEKSDRDKDKIFTANCKSRHYTEESSLKALIGYFKSKEYISLYETSNAISNVKVEIKSIDTTK